MGRIGTAAGLLAAALALAAVSGEAYQRVGSGYVRYEGVGPGWDSTRVVVGGWPLPYLLDRPYLSPVGSVSVSGGLLGEDELRAGPFLADAAFYLLLSLGLLAGVRRLRRAG